MEDTLKLISYILEQPLIYQLGLYIILLLVLCSIIALVIFPLIFNYIIIPRIEERLGAKIVSWGYIVEMRPLGRIYMKYMVVASSVLIQTVLLKFFKNSDMLIKKSNKNASWTFDLAKANYDVRQATKFEIVMSFLALANILLCIILAIIFWFFIRGKVKFNC